MQPPRERLAGVMVCERVRGWTECMLRTRLHYAHVHACLLCQPVDAQVEIVLQTANGQKVRPIARQNGGSEEVAGSSRLKAMKVCPSLFCGRGCGRGGGTTLGAADMDDARGSPFVLGCIIAVLHTSSDGVFLSPSLPTSFPAVHLSRRPNLPLCLSLRGLHPAGRVFGSK